MLMIILLLPLLLGWPMASRRPAQAHAPSGLNLTRGALPSLVEASTGVEVYLKRENSGSWNSGLEKEQILVHYSAHLQMP
ncbi:hypothetical protein ZWY2020_049200 [Hordeum vulgare]|nr:hypothetical protein ZWY2020_049200 [Hordeum vulgare]